MKFDSPKIKLDLKAPEDIGNLAEKLDQHTLRQLADHVIELVKIDERSMSDWLGKANGYLDSIDSDTNQAAPASGREQQGSNEDGPPSTAMTLSAVVQFAARIVSALLSEPDLARASEPGGEALAAWMSSQLRTVDPDWVTDTDPLVLHMGVTGLGWRKRWFDEHDGQYRSTFLPVNEVIINSNTKSLERTPRITHHIEKYPYEIQRSIELGHWVDYEPDFDDTDPQEPQKFYEVDMWLDMDGDEYDEPWTVTVALEDIPCVVKCIPRWSKKTVVNTDEMLLFRPHNRYYAYKMIPDPKGSFLPRGFGWLLSRSENSADRLLASINDTAQSSAENGGVAAVGGIGLPDKIELTANRLTTINTDGRSINDTVSLFPAKQVTPGMFQTLDKIMTLGDRLAGTLNLLENAPASMTATLAKGIIDNGAQVHSAVHRRIIGAITEELRAFAAMADGAGHLPQGIDGSAPIEVTADPNMSTEMHRGVAAQAYHDMLQFPLVFNPHEVALRYAQTMRFPDPEKLLAPPMPASKPTDAEKSAMMLEIEKEKTNRIKATAQSALAAAQAIKALTDAGVGAYNIDMMRMQLATLEKTMESLANDTNSVGGNGQGVVGQPANPPIANGNQNPAGPNGAGTPVGSTGQLNSAGTGSGVPMAVPPVGLAAG
jgi:hypothetical protein